MINSPYLHKELKLTVTGDVTDLAKLCRSLKSVTHKTLKVKSLNGESLLKTCAK